MHIIKKITLFLVPLITLSLMTPSHAFFWSKEKPHINWKKVSQASAYRVEIKNRQGKIVLTEKTEDTILYLDIPDGRYKARISVLDSAGKTRSKSDWFNISIKKSERPEFDSLSVQYFSSGSGKTDVRLSGEGFMKGCKVYLQLGKKRIRVRNVKYISKDRLAFPIIPKSLKRASYDVVVENPGGKTEILKDHIQIKRLITVTDISPSSSFFTEKPVDIRIEGGPLAKDVEIQLEMGKRILRFSPAYVAPEGIKFLLDMNNKRLKKGYYDLVLKNPGQKPRVVKHAFRVKSKKDGFLALYGLYTGIGYEIAAVLPEWNDVIEHSFFGFSIYAGYPLNAFSIFKDIFILNKFGIELEFINTKYQVKEETNRVDSSLQTISFANGINYTESFNTPFDFIFHTTYGYSYTRAIAEGGKVDNTSITTWDPFCSFGFSFRYTYLYNYFAEVGHNYQRHLYMDNNLNLIRTYFRIGLRL